VTAAWATAGVATGTTPATPRTHTRPSPNPVTPAKPGAYTAVRKNNSISDKRIGPGLRQDDGLICSWWKADRQV
jgi:hypothetical protein